MLFVHPDIVVGIAAKLWTEMQTNHGSIPDRTRNSSLLHSFKTGSEGQPTFCTVDTKALCLETNRQERGAVTYFHLPPRLTRQAMYVLRIT